MRKFFSKKQCRQALEQFAGKKNDGVLIFFPSIGKFLSVAFGDGSNADVLEEGSTGYLYLNSYIYDGIAYQDDDGGILEFDEEKSREYGSEIVNAVFDAANYLFGTGTADMIPAFVPIQAF